MIPKSDILFIGLGLSTACTIIQLLKLGYQGSITVLERQKEPDREKRWSCWGPLPQDLSRLVSNRWEQWSLALSGSNHLSTSTQNPYSTILADDFWSAFFAFTGSYTNLNFYFETDVAGNPVSYPGLKRIETSKGHFQAGLILDSRPPGIPNYYYVQQFVGYTVTADRPYCDPRTVQLMHFCPEVRDHIAFLYCLPQEANTAFVEYTLFDGKPHPSSELETRLKWNLKHYYGIDDSNSSLSGREEGFLPMGPLNTTKPVPGYWPIGMASGALRASSGYGLLRIYQQSVDYAKAIMKNKPLPPPSRSPWMENFLDRQFVRVLKQNPLLGQRMLFRSASMTSTPTFVRMMRGDWDLSLAMKVVGAMPALPFLWALLQSRFS